jgi:cysteinyl-tRNA synthetase
MNQELKIYNSLTKEKEVFKSIKEGQIGMYVCGPTVYSDVHLGNCRTFMNFDIIYRYLKYLGYQVRYVRNITDVGHLTDIGDDKMLHQAKALKLEPMEVAQHYTVGFHEMMRILNVLPPSIEPRATGHIIEQIEMVKDIIDNGFAYEANGSVYFDTIKFANKTGEYGRLSGRIIEDLLAESRELKNQEEKRNPSDFAIWMKAHPEHILRWNSPWSEGFPGWHLECSAMSTKYLGKTFDIHGGGMDLKFPHHENEVAQNHAACGCSPAKVWMHANMLLLNGKKMSKSDGNIINPYQLFTGKNTLMSKPYSAIIFRFYVLQAHYGSTLDITDEGLSAAEKGYKRLMESWKSLQALQASGSTTNRLDTEITGLIDAVFAEMNDDFNCPKVLSKLFELVTIINSIKGGQLSISDVSISTLERLKATFHSFIFDIFGLIDETSSNSSNHIEGLMNLILEMRQQARTEKNWTASDKIRDGLSAAGIVVKDGKDGVTWNLN